MLGFFIGLICGFITGAILVCLITISKDEK